MSFDDALLIDFLFLSQKRTKEIEKMKVTLMEKKLGFKRENEI